MTIVSSDINIRYFGKLSFCRITFAVWNREDDVLSITAIKNVLNFKSWD